MRRRLWLCALSSLLLCAVDPRAQVSADRLAKAASEPQNWLTYSGSYMSQRHSALKQITTANAKNLELKWVFQAQSLQTFESTPLVVDGIMYVTQAPNDVVALDAKTGRVFWIYHYVLPQTLAVCCGQVNRGVAILGDTLFMGTLDAHLVAIDAKNGRKIWDTKVAENSLGYALAVSPLVVKDKVIVGVAGGEYGIRGFIAAYDAETGKEAWRFYTIPGPGRAGPRHLAGRQLGARRRLRLGDRLLRSGAQPDLLGHRQSRARLESRRSARATTCIRIPWSRSTPTRAR